MSLNRHAKRRDANENKIIATFVGAGFEVHRLDLPVDLLVMRGGINYLVEVKSDAKAKLTKGQQTFFETCRGQVTCVASVADAEALIAMIDQGDLVPILDFRGQIS
ncbi:MAG: hypothetical protein AAF198_06360 [Pseudomonadota bacterium]